MPSVPEEPAPQTRAERRARERAEEQSVTTPGPAPSPQGSAPATMVPPVAPQAAAPATPVPDSSSAISAAADSGVPPQSPPGKGAKLKKKRPRRPVTVVGVIGELLMTAGILLGLYLAWQVWYNDIVERAAQNDVAASLSEQWEKEYPADSPPSGVTPVLAAPVDGETFANLRIPRFGDDFAQALAGGVSKAKTLDRAFIGHYPTTAVPGEAGNFALAGHRNTHGAPLNRIADFRVGDAIVVESPEGWYTYRYRNTEYVPPSAGDVLNPVPRTDTVNATDSLITLTSCNPKMSTAERIISYGVFESFTPRSAGAPASLTSVTEG